MIKFVGRKDELSQIRKLVASNRLVTIVGVGGVGKTRLVCEFIKDLRSIFVPLESVNNAVVADLLDATIQELESTPVDVLATTIVILDNAEHVSQIVKTKIHDILALGCRIIITSREPIIHSLESVMRLLPFDRQQTELFLRTLFTQQNLAIETELPSFNYDAIYSLLDGLALAVEIVATKLSVLSFDEQRTYLENQIFPEHPESSVKPNRHRTLVDTFEWSWAILSEESRHALSRTALFSEPFTRSAANAVCETSPIIVDLALGDLMQKSLLRRETIDGKTQFKMLHAVRTFAASKLSPEERSTTMDTIALHYIQDLFSTTKLLRKSHTLWLPLKRLFKSPDVSDSVKLKIYRGLQSLESIVLDTSFRNDFNGANSLQENSLDADFVEMDIAQSNNNWSAFNRKFEKFLTRPGLNNAMIVDVLWMVNRFGPESMNQIDALKARLKTVDDHHFSFWIQEATFRSRNGMEKEAEVLFEKAQHYADDHNNEIMINFVALCRGFIAMREYRFEDADYFLQRAKHESTPPTANGYHIDVLRRLGKTEKH